MSENQNGQLGWIVSWRVPASVKLQDLRTAIASAAINPELLAEVKPEQALRRALRDMSDNRVIRKLRREGDSVYFQLTHETVTESSASYSREAEVCLDCNSGTVTCAESSEIAQTAQALLDEHANKRLTMDLTRLLQKFFDSKKADLIPIREQGGAYFVPEMHSALVESARALLSAIGGKLRTFAVRFGSGDTAESIADSLADYLQDLIREFRESCTGITSETRSDAKSNRLETVSSLKSKLELYSGLLAGFSSTIGNELQSAEIALLKALATPPVPDTADSLEVAHA